MEGFPLVVPVTVRFRDCDALGHVNNAVYFTFLEEARFAWFKSVFGPEAWHAHPIILGEASCTFRASAKPYDELLIGIRVSKIGTKSFDHAYRVESKSGTLIAEAKSTGVGFDFEKNVTRELGAAFRAAVEKHQGSVK